MAPEVNGRVKVRRRAKTPMVLQLEAVECGAAALGMILAYHGRIEPLAVLRLECGVSRDGSKALNMVKAARRYGMNAKGFSKTVEKLHDLDPPFIVFWNFNHYVVVEGFDRDKVHLNDPACGHRTVSAEEFDRGFTGVTLVMEPGPDFEKGGRQPSMREAISSRLHGMTGAIAYCTIAGFLLVLPGLALPAFTRIFIDDVLLQNRVNWLRPLILAMMIALLVQIPLRYLQLRHLRRLQIMLSIRLSNRFMWHLLRLPARFFAQRFAGEVAQRSQLNTKLADALSGRPAQTVIDVVMVGFYAALMIYYDSVLASIGIVCGLGNVVLLRIVSERRVEDNMRVLQEYGKAEGTAVAGLQRIETIKASGLESGFFSRWSGYHAKAANARQDLEFSNQSLSLVPGILESLTMALLLIVGALRIVDGQLSIGTLVAIQSLTQSFLLPIGNLVNLGGFLQELRGDLDRVDDVLDYPVMETSPVEKLYDEQREQVTRLKGHVELKNVTFGYSPLEPPLIDALDISIRPGERVALVGGSGSGKSTIARIMTGELEPWEGEVLFDGIPRRELPNDVLVNSFAVVEQAIFLFSGTVRANLTMWDETIPDDDLVHACEDASIDEVVRALPGGFGAELVEGGENLSGGEQQRLELARALVNNPSILVLDEATSALDTETERVVIERLRMRGCTCVFVSHRLSAIRDCEEIIVLDRGRVVERGTHEDLISEEGAYSHLIRSVASEGVESSE